MDAEGTVRGTREAYAYWTSTVLGQDIRFTRRQCVSSLRYFFVNYCLRRFLSDVFRVLTQYSATVSFVNLSSRVRFSNAGWQLVALLPVPNKKQGSYKGKMSFKMRKNQLFSGTKCFRMPLYGFLFV